MLILLVKLADEGQEILIRFIVERKQRDFSFDQLSLTDKEDLDTHPAFVDTVAKDITVHQICQSHFLSRHDGIDCLDLIPQLSRSFKL